MATSQELVYGTISLPKWLRILLFPYISFEGKIELYKKEGGTVPPNKYKFTLYSILYTSLLWVGMVIAHILFFFGFENIPEDMIFILLIFVFAPYSVIFIVLNFRYRYKKRTQKITIEKQLEALASLGITPNHELFLEWLCKNSGRQLAEDMPWYIVLNELGGWRELESGWEPLSNDVFAFVTKDVKDNDFYTTIINRLSFYAKGSFNVDKVLSTTNRESKKMMVSFMYVGTQYNWQLNFDDNCFDFSLIDKVNALLKDRNAQNLFHTCLVNQNLLILYASDETIQSINRLDNLPLYLKFAVSTDTPRNR